MKTLSKTALKAKRPRRLNSAREGGVFLSIQDLMVRWGVVRRTAMTRIREAGIPPYNLSTQCVRYALEDITAFEQSAKR